MWRALSPFRCADAEFYNLPLGPAFFEFGVECGTMFRENTSGTWTPRRHGGDVPLGKPLLNALDRMGHGGLVLNTAGQVIQINDTGKRLLRENGGGQHDHDPDWTRQALKALLRSAGAARFRMDEDAWVAIRRDADHSRPLVLHAVPITEGAASGPHTVVILVDLDATRGPKPKPYRRSSGSPPPRQG